MREGVRSGTGTCRRCSEGNGFSARHSSTSRECVILRARSIQVHVDLHTGITGTNQRHMYRRGTHVDRMHVPIT